MNLTVRTLLLAAFALLFFGYTAGHAAEVDDVRLVREFGKGEVITGGVAYHGKAYFLVNSDMTRSLALWATDGTPEHTTLVRRIEGETGSEDNILTNQYATDLSPEERDAPLLLDDRFCFFTSDAAAGTQNLWCSDGTAAGTATVAAVPEGCSGRNEGVLLQGILHVLNQDCLWRSNGTQAGTWKVSGAFNNAMPPVVFDHRLYFSAHDFIHARELWVSDGTPGGTRVLRDINQDNNSYCDASTPAAGTGLPLSSCDSSSNPGNLLVYNNQLFFTAFHPLYGIELWKTNGTLVQLVKDIKPGNDGLLYAFSFQVVNSRILIAANDGQHGQELWVSDGTTSGTVLLKDVTPGWEGGVGSFLGQIDGSLFFQGRDGENLALWKSDGTKTGTVMVKGGRYTFGSELAPSPFRENSLDGCLYFLSGYNGTGLWGTDGTAGGTREFFNQLHAQWYPPLGGNSALFNNTLYLAAGDRSWGDGGDVELWAVQGTQQRLVKDLLPANGQTELSSFPRRFLPLANTLVFFARSSWYYGSDSLLYREGVFALTPRQVTLPWLKPLLLKGP